MPGFEPRPYKDYRWIVADPLLLGGTLAIRGTRLSVALILECLANGMTLDDIDESFEGTFPREALPGNPWAQPGRPRLLKPRNSFATV